MSAIGAGGPEKKAGWALVATGPWTLSQILPAFALCRHSRPVALVSRDGARTRRLARRFGISEKAVYDLAEIDRLAGDAEVQVVYLVLPERLQKEYAGRAAKTGKDVLCEKRTRASGAAATAAAGPSSRVAYRRPLERPCSPGGADPLALEMDRFSLLVRRRSTRIELRNGCRESSASLDAEETA